MIVSIARFLSTPEFLFVWGAVVAICLIVLLLLLAFSRPALPPLVQAIWFVAVLYSGPLGLAVYLAAGRPGLRKFPVLRKSLRSIAPTASGYAFAHTLAAVITAGALSIPNWAVVAIGFPFAYFFSFGVIAFPLIRHGVPPKDAFTEAFYSESAVVTVMEIVGTPTFLAFASTAGLGDTRFWSSLVFSIIAGVALAAPFNFALVLLGMKREPYDPDRPRTREDLTPQVSHLRRLASIHHADRSDRRAG